VRRLGLIAGLALAAAAPAGIAQAATIQVSGPPETALGEAILEAEPGDTIEIPAGEYLLTEGDTLEAKDLTLRGAGADQTTIVPSGGGDALDDSGVTLKGLTEGIARQPSEAVAAEEEADNAGIETQAQIIALVATLSIFLLVLELVRRRRLVERYALLWMTAAIALLVLSIWTGGLDVIANAMGIAEPANAIFILAFGVAFLLLLNFSVASSRLSEETKVLAQEVARLDQELRRERSLRGGDGNGFTSARPSARAEQPQDDAPVRRQ